MTYSPTIARACGCGQTGERAGPSPTLKWKNQAGYGNTIVGFLGKHRVCSIYFRCIRDGNGSYALVWNLPSINNTADEKYDNEQSALKGVAEAMLISWLKDAGLYS